MQTTFNLTIVFLLIICVNSQNLTLEQQINQVILDRKIVNRHDFNFILNPGREICYNNESKDLLVLIYVHSAPDNFKRRVAIRETWAKHSIFKNIRLVFMLGLNKNNLKVQQLIRLESNVYNDLVQEDFEDSYKNLTYKGIMSLKWISNYCPIAKYILKIDDDIIVNTFTLLRHLNSLQKHDITRDKKRTIMCLVWDRMIVQRDTKQKWYLSVKEYKYDYFGKYCSGSAFMFTSDLAAPMFKASFHVKFLWIDDYYISGMLGRACSATYESINSLYIVNRNLVEQQFLGKKSYYTIFGHMPQSINKVYSIWNYIVKKELQKNHRNKHFIGDFNWHAQIWDPFIRDEESKEDLDFNLIENFAFNENF